MHSKKALIIKFGAIGDVVMTVPAVRALHDQGFEIHWVCGKTVRPLLECYSWIRLIPVDDRAILRGNALERIQGIFNLWTEIAGAYDLSATLYYDRRYRLLSLPVRAPRKLMLSRASRATTLLAGRHHTDEYVRILLGLDDHCREQSFPPVAPDCLPPSPLPEKTAARRIALVPGGTHNLLKQQVMRRWPIEHYLDLTRRLLDRSWEVVLFGGQEDLWVKPHFQNMTVTDCIGKLSLPEVVSVCNHCDAVVTHDTGPMHLAGLSETSLIGIFGPTNPGNFLPRRPFAVGIWGGQGFACRPCYDGHNFAPCEFNGCMHQVAPELVLRELDRLLDDRSKQLDSAWRVVSPDESSQPAPGPLTMLPSA
ncbi:glycosyltransferase family 9 protein [Edaphobacter sp.]|uniref:glycosyltransferase family 9 protein n=1 Tax=Edaphobacter sp. TaxID=1934404 RepID=UPI002DBE7C16|nr:glycosyltransferase family 9 protein [Edaphobacter sp.]HEU5339901.1 glycosyltransferase family 9 protein [Edaphobacter sp.]